MFFTWMIFSLLMMHSFIDYVIHQNEEQVKCDKYDLKITDSFNRLIRYIVTNDA